MYVSIDPDTWSALAAAGGGPHKRTKDKGQRTLIQVKDL